MSERRLLALPPFASALAAFVLVVASLAANGAADSVGYPAWLPMAGGLMTALPVLLLSMAALLQVRRETATEFNLNRTRALLGGAVYVTVAALMLAYAATIGRASSYQGEFDAATQRFKPEFTQAAFIFASLVFTVVVVVAMQASTRMLYLAAIDHQRDQVEGPDPLGALMKS